MKKLLFNSSVKETRHKKETSIDFKMLVEMQAKMIVSEYKATCFDVKQLQKILNVGESNVYQLLRSGKLPSLTVGRRKVVPVVELAQFLVMGD